MNLRDSYFTGDVEDDVKQFASRLTRKRVLLFPPVNNYRRFLIHQLVQEQYAHLLHTFSIGQGQARRTVVCFKSDVIRDPKTMGIEEKSPVTTPEHNIRQRQGKPMPAVEIYRPPAVRRALKEERSVSDQEQVSSDNSVRSNRQRRPDRAVYVPRHRRDAIDSENHPQSRDTPSKPPCERGNKLSLAEMTKPLLIKSNNAEVPSKKRGPIDCDENFECNKPETIRVKSSAEYSQSQSELPSSSPPKWEEAEKIFPNEIVSNYEQLMESHDVGSKRERESEVEDEGSKDGERYITEEVIQESENQKNKEVLNQVDKVLIISDQANEMQRVEESRKEVPVIPVTPPEKKVKKIERPKSKPAVPPSPAIKINRDECDWENIFDDNGDCLDPTLIEELTSAVGEVIIEQPKNTIKSYTKPMEVSNDEYAHVIEIYNFPSEFKTSDLAAVFSPFKNGGFELKWVDDTHCLGVFSSALIAAEVLASDHPFVKTRPLSEATALSKTKARRSSEFLQPYKSRPETCAALARRLVTGALGVKLATARQEREHEKIVLREAKERRRLANKQRDDAWEGVIAQK